MTRKPQTARHCRSAATGTLPHGDGAAATPPSMPLPDDDEDGGGEDAWPRPLMTQPAVVTLRRETALPHLHIPVLVRPEDKGIVLFEALHQAVGRPEAAFGVVFHGLRIEAGTPLRDFGFRTGDVIPVQELPPQP